MVAARLRATSRRWPRVGQVGAGAAFTALAELDAAIRDAEV